MKLLSTSLLITTLALGSLSATSAWAQAQSQQTQHTAQMQSASTKAVDPSSVAGWAGQVVAMVDRGQLAQLWNGASAVTKQSVKRENFIAQVQAARKPLGAVSGREWAVVRRQRNAASKEIPAGEYASVELVTRFADSQQIRTELVTFRHDEDGTWRFTGYVAR